MNKKTIISSLCLLSVIFLHAQTLSMDFPAFAGKSYELVIFQGSKSIKVIQDTIPAGGKFEMKIPEQYAPYQGMCRWLLTNSKEGGGLDMSIPGYGFSVSCSSENPDNTNIVCTGYDPLGELNRLNIEQQKIIDKYQAVSRSAELYAKDAVLYPIFSNEMKIQQKAFDDFSSALKRNTNLGARFLPISNIIKGIPPHLSRDYNVASKEIAGYITNELDMDFLYRSGNWSSVLDTWVQIETNLIEDDREFINSFEKLSVRIKNPVKYNDFVTCITKSLTRYGKEKQISLISSLVLNSGKIEEYSGVLSVYQKALIGTVAPDLVVNEHPDNNRSSKGLKSTILSSKTLARSPYTQTLVIFYESSCGACKDLMEQLPGQYEELKRRGVRIIAISGDVDKKVFTETASRFPWKDTYCDFESWKGINFKNYAVSGTPTIFLLDSEGKIKDKIATLKDIMKITKKQSE